MLVPCLDRLLRRERQKESTEINASLYALKECVRARALQAKGKRAQIPFRSSNLTKVAFRFLSDGLEPKR